MRSSSFRTLMAAERLDALAALIAQHIVRSAVMLDRADIVIPRRATAGENDQQAHEQDGAQDPEKGAHGKRSAIFFHSAHSCALSSTGRSMIGWSTGIEGIVSSSDSS